MLSLNNIFPTISAPQRICLVSTVLAQKSKNQCVLVPSSLQRAQNSSPMLSCRASLEVVHDSPSSDLRQTLISIDKAISATFSSHGKLLMSPPRKSEWANKPVLCKSICMTKSSSVELFNRYRVSMYSNKFQCCRALEVEDESCANKFHRADVIESQQFDREILSAIFEVPLVNGSAVHGLSETVVGVLGGGQLGRMLCEAASQMAIKVIVLDPMENCPASALAHQHVVGSYDDSATVEEFGKRCGVLTVEIEHVDVTTLEKLEQHGVDCQPKASTIRTIQDKYLQKVHFSRHGIPLPKFMQVDNLESARRAGDMFGYPLMIKSRRLAYDGRGNAVAKSEEQLSSAVNALGGYDRGLYVEKWAPFVKELSVIVARGRDNSIACYPAVETIHRDNICHIVKSPANVSWKIMKLATDVAHRAVSSLEGAGVFAVELFLTEDGQILLNEVAPRPHNSGHHTIEACFTSQYEQHLRAVVGLPLGDPSMKTPAAVMYNILGEDDGEPGFLLANQLIGRALGIPGASIHWYNKSEMRRQRKMGHITIVGPSMGVVEAQLKVMLNEGSVDGQPAAAPCVGIIMGSDSDLPVMKDAAKILKEFDVPAEVKIVSAHRTPEMMFSYALSARERGIQVIIAGAGGAAHLPGMVAALTPLPVIGVPVRASTLDGLDSLLSIVQMPRGVPVATVAINNATNAGLLAVRLLGISDIKLQARMAQYQEDRRDEVLVKGERLENVGYEEYLNS